MGRVKRPLIIAVAVIAFLAVAFFVARWLNNDTDERGAVVDAAASAQAQGRRGRDAARRSNCPDAACEALVRANAQRLSAPRRGEDRALPVADRARPAQRARSRRASSGSRPGQLTTVQCVLVRRKGQRVRRYLG